MLTKFPVEEAKSQYLNSQIQLYAKLNDFFLIRFGLQENDKICHWPSEQSNKLNIYPIAGYIYPCIHGNMPDIYFLAYAAICRTYIVACRRQYAGAENICVRLLPLLLQLHIPPPNNLPNLAYYCIIAFLHYCNMPKRREYVLCNEIIGTL